MWSARLAAAALVVADGTANQLVPAASTSSPDETLRREPDGDDLPEAVPSAARHRYPQRTMAQYGPAPGVRLPLAAEPGGGRIRKTVTPATSPVG